MLAEIDALQSLGEDVLGDAARPLVEVAQHDLRTGDAPIVDERRQLARLAAPLEERRAEVHVVEVQRVVVQREIDALHAAVLAGLPRQIVLNVMPDRETG